MSLSAPSYHRSTAAGFNFTAHMRYLCAHIVENTRELRHVDLERVAVAFAQARKGVAHGLQASLTPLRFAGGDLTTARRGRRYTIQRLFDPNGREMLYILTFYLPRFMQTDLREKLITIFHELWHISPDFNGDLRRHPGRCYAHTHSQHEYDRQMWALAERWLSSGPPEALFSFLTGSFDDLCRHHGRVYGMKVTKPKLMPVE